MKNILYLAAVTLLCSSCFQVNTNWNGGKNAIKGEGPVVAKTFDDLKDFDRIEINGHADVNFTQSSVYEVTLHTQENVLDYVDYRVEGTTLIIETKDRRNIRAKKYDLEIQAPNLCGVVVNGAADFDIPYGLTVKDEGDLSVQVNGSGDLSFHHVKCMNLSIQVNGAADVELESVDVLKKLAVEVNGAGDAEIHGSAGEASFGVNGAGGIDARGLKVAGKVSKHVSGLAKIQL